MYSFKTTAIAIGIAAGTALLASKGACAAPFDRAASFPGSNASLAPVQGGPIEASPADVLAFWTYAKMKEAETSSSMFVPPGDDPYWPGVGDANGYLPVAPTDANVNNYVVHPLTRLNGVLFFVEIDGETLAHCSASVIRSQSKSVILTAAHCFNDGDEAGWKRLALFVPAYKGDVPESQRAPLGRWVVKQAFIPYYGAGLSGDDVAAARVYPDANTDNALLQDIVGDALVPRYGRADEAFPLVDIYGYPGTNVHHDMVGLQWHCLSRGTKAGDDLGDNWLQAPQCSAQSGNSGGPAVLNYLDGKPSEVIAVAHSWNNHSRLMDANFSAIFAAADAGSAATSKEQ